MIFVGNQQYAHLKFWDGSIGVDGPWTQRKYHIEFDCSNGSRPITEAALRLDASKDLKMTSKASLYPNPTSGALNVSFESEMIGDHTFEVYDALGKRLLNEKRKILKGGNHFTFDTEKLRPGVYFLKLPNVSSQQAPLRFIKI